MRGLRVIIAGAGLSAALPGVVAAHTDLPVIGVPLTRSTSVAGRPRRAALDRADAAGRAGRLRRPRQRAQRGRPGGARYLERVIERYTRPEIGAALDRRGAHGGVAATSRWRRARSWTGRRAADLEAIRARDLHRRGGPGARGVTDHDVAAFVDVLPASAGPAGAGSTSG